MDTLIAIPARVASTRLQRKMLSDIGGKPLIVRTLESVKASGVGDVIVACDGEEIADAVHEAGGIAILTDPELQSGTDRVFSACKLYDKNNKYKYIINVQGDMPFVSKTLVQEAVKIVRESDYDFSTLATPIRDESYLLDSVVKPVIAYDELENANKFNTIGNAIYFSRSAVPFGGPYYHHVGIYCFRSEALEKFVSLPQSYLEKTERLEQLRGIENGMKIGIKLIDEDSPISVDTSEDLKRAVAYWNNNINHTTD